MKSKSVVLNPFTLGLSIMLTASALLMAACHPNDEKISNRSGGFNSQTDETDAALGDRVTEYSRSMLVEVADVVRQAEGALAVSSPAKLFSCQESKPVSAGTGGFSYETQMTACSEKGPNFEGKQSGRETYTVVTRSAESAATVTPVSSAPVSSGAVVTSFKVEGRAIETVLTPKVNPKDSLRVETNRVLEARLIGETAAERLYDFTYENHSPYNLSLKALTDGGLIRSKIHGVLVYGLKEAKITTFRDGVMSIQVDSARMGRGGGRLIRQEFSAVGTTGGSSKTLVIDLASCALPQGSVDVQFSVRPVLAREKEKVVDSTTVIDSFNDHVVNTKIDPAPATSKATAKLCSASGQMTVTEFYAGLLY